jgi:hypothetical protein
MRFIPPRRVLFWFFFEVLAALLPHSLTMFFLLAEGKLNFERAISTPELAFFAGLVGAITLGDLLDFSDKIEKDVRTLVFVVLMGMVFVNFFFFVIMFAIQQDQSNLPKLTQTLPSGEIVPKMMVSYPPFLMALLVLVGGTLCQIAFSRLENTREKATA